MPNLDIEYIQLFSELDLISFGNTIEIQTSFKVFLEPYGEKTAQTLKITNEAGIYKLIYTIDGTDFTIYTDARTDAEPNKRQYDNCGNNRLIHFLESSVEVDETFYNWFTPQATIISKEDWNETIKSYNSFSRWIWKDVIDFSKTTDNFIINTKIIVENIEYNSFHFSSLDKKIYLDNYAVYTEENGWIYPVDFLATPNAAIVPYPMQKLWTFNSLIYLHNENSKYQNSMIINKGELPTIKVTYNGKQITTLGSSEQRTLECEGKLMRTNIVITAPDNMIGGSGSAIETYDGKVDIY